MAVLSTHKKKEKGYKVISTGFYNPKTNALTLGKVEKCVFATYSCKCSNKCEAYKHGMCLLKNGLMGSKCPFGEIKRRMGVDPNYDKYYIIVSSFQLKNTDTLNKLKEIHRIIGVGGEYIYLPLKFLDNNVNPISIELGIKDGNLLPKDKFTVDNLVKLIMYRPIYPSGQLVEHYIERLVPEFVFQLKNFYPEMYSQVCKVITNLETEALPKVDFINKYAKVKTLNPGVVKMGTFMCYWSGKEILCRSSSIKDLFGIKSKEEMHIIPYAGTICKIVDPKTVNENTIFV